MYSCSHTAKTKEIFPLSKEVRNVEREYMNVPPPLNVAAGALKKVINRYLLYVMEMCG